MPKMKGLPVIFCDAVVKSPQRNNMNYMFFWVEMVDICWKINALFPLFPLCFELLSSYSPSVRDFFVHIIHTTGTKKTFCWCYSQYTRKLLSVSLQASVKTYALKTDILTSQMNLKFLNWAILPFKLQCSTRNQKGKGKLLRDCFHL